MRYLMLAAAVGSFVTAPANAADRLSGAWTTGGPTPQTFVFKTAGDAFGGIVCGPCDDPATVFHIEAGRILDDTRVAFSIAYDTGGPRFKEQGSYREQVTGTFSGNQLSLQTQPVGRSAAVVTSLKRVVEGFVPDTSAVKGTNLLTADPQGPPSAIEGRWVFAGRNAQQNVILKVRGQNVWGLICGPCNPDGVFLIDDGSFDGTTMKFYINHIDTPPSGQRVGVQRNAMTGTLSDSNVMKFKWVREGAENQPGGEMTLIGPIRQDRRE
jgi:hypothetical protein